MAEEEYLENLRKMPGAKKVKIGAELYEVALKIAKAGVRDQFPHLSEKEIAKKVKERLPK